MLILSFGFVPPLDDPMCAARTQISGQMQGGSFGELNAVRSNNSLERSRQP